MNTKGHVVCVACFPQSLRNGCCKCHQRMTDVRNVWMENAAKCLKSPTGN